MVSKTADKYNNVNAVTFPLPVFNDMWLLTFGKEVSLE